MSKAKGVLSKGKFWGRSKSKRKEQDPDAPSGASASGSRRSSVSRSYLSKLKRGKSASRSRSASESEQPAQEHVAISIHDEQPDMVTPDQPEHSDQEEPKKKSKSFMSKAKGWWKSKPKKETESDLECGKAIPSSDESDNKKSSKMKPCKCRLGQEYVKLGKPVPKNKKCALGKCEGTGEVKKKGWWKRTKGYVSKKKKGALQAVGLKKKDDDDGDRGAACCCPNMSYTTRMICFTLFYLAGLGCSVAAMFFIWDTTSFNHKMFQLFYIIGCVLTLGSVFFLAGVCRQIRVSMRYGRWTCLLLAVACIVVTMFYAVNYKNKAPLPGGTANYTPAELQALQDDMKVKRGQIKEIIVLLLLIAQTLAWFWYVLSYMPCGRKIVHCCCKSDKDKDKDKK